MGKQQNYVSDFQWHSASEYFRHIEVQAGLLQFSLSAVYSFYIPPDKGVPGLIAQKIMLSQKLEQNLARIKEWVKMNADELGEREMSLVRSLWKTTRNLSAIVEGQLLRAEELADWEQLTFDLDVGESELEDDLPF